MLVQYFTSNSNQFIKHFGTLLQMNKTNLSPYDCRCRRPDLCHQARCSSVCLGERSGFKEFLWGMNGVKSEEWGSGLGFLPPAQSGMRSQAKRCCPCTAGTRAGALAVVLLFPPVYQGSQPCHSTNRTFPAKAKRRFTFGNTVLSVTNGAAASLPASLPAAVPVTSLTWF